MKYLAGCFFSALLGGLLAIWFLDVDTDSRISAQVLPGQRDPGLSGQVPASPASPQLPGVFDKQGLTAEESVNVAVYKAVNKGVVHITTKGSRIDGFFFLEVPSEGTGSGTVIDKAGHILTNLHVIEDAHEVAVTLYNGKTYDATFVGADPVNDVSVIKINAPKDEIHPVTMGDSKTLRVGMRVFAIGNPFGLERTLTTGIISSLNRSLQIRGNRTIKSIIQIDAAINPGSSGGPLLDTHGRLIGMNTAIFSKTGQSSGVGFAIPVNLVSRVVPELITHGRVIRPEIGIQKVFETERGLLIARLTPNGPADRAGLRGPRIIRRRRGPFIIERVDRSAADLIVAVDGKELKTADDFLDMIERKKPNDRVVLTIIRDGRRMDVPIILSKPVGNPKTGGTRQ